MERGPAPSPGCCPHPSVGSWDVTQSPSPGFSSQAGVDQGPAPPELKWRFSPQPLTLGTSPPQALQQLQRSAGPGEGDVHHGVGLLGPENPEAPASQRKPLCLWVPSPDRNPIGEAATPRPWVTMWPQGEVLGQGYLADRKA